MATSSTLSVDTVTGISVGLFLLGMVIGVLLGVGGAWMWYTQCRTQKSYSTDHRVNLTENVAYFETSLRNNPFYEEVNSGDRDDPPIEARDDASHEGGTS